MDFLFTLFIASFDVQKILILMKSSLFIFSFWLCFWYHIQKIPDKSNVMKLFLYAFF